MPRRRKDYHWLYFLVKDSVIVYIGVTRDLVQRMKSHKDKDHNSARARRFDSKCEAMAYERRWIRKFNPKYNAKIPVYSQYYSNIKKPLTTFVSRESHLRVKQKAKEFNMTISEYLRQKLELV